MAAPSATTRIDPTTVGGIMMPNGFPIKVTIKRFPSIKFKEKTGSPPGIDGGNEVETTDMFRTRYNTARPRKLMKMQPVKLTASFDSWVYAQIVEAVNVNDEITFAFPDGSTIAFWGYLQKFDIKAFEDGKQPEADVTILPTMEDNAGVEQPFVLVEVTGT